MASLKLVPLAQMTIKAIGADPKDAIRQDAQVFMARIFGEATDAKTKESRNGDPYTYLVGTFRAQRPASDAKEKAEFGDVVTFEAEKLFLPSTLQEKIEGQLKATGKTVQFGYDVYSTPDKNVSVGYRYAAKAVMETAASDRLSVMAKELEATPMPGAAVEKQSKKK